MYRYIKAIAAMAFSAALFLASRPCVYANNDYLAYTNPETEMETTTSITVTVDYVGNYVYENGTLKKILFEGGYVDMTGSTPKYMYYLTDHLGNVRVVADSDGNIAQVNHYYPYGDRFNDNRYALSSSSTSSNDRLFGGKELDSSSGLHDFEARYDNTKFGRFTTMDPLAEKYFGVSPYSYCTDDPINILDPTGKDIWEINNLGVVINRLDDNKQDAIYEMALNDGVYQRTGNHISFDYGTIEAHCSWSNDRKNSPGITDIFQVRGDNNGTALFEFLARVVSGQEVEVSQIMCGTAGENGLNYITSAHQTPIIEDGMKTAMEYGFTHLYNNQLRYGYTIREINHSHPFTNKPSNNDRAVAELVRQSHKSSNFNVWHVQSKTYIPF